MSNFDKNKINILLIYDDETFSLFVSTLRKEICPYVLSNKKKYANALKFLCIVHHIVARKTSMNDFDVLLQELVPGIGSMLSSMKLRKDANEEKNYRLYADPKRRKDDSCYLLTRDCSEMEEMLQPVIERLEEK